MAMAMAMGIQMMRVNKNRDNKKNKNNIQMKSKKIVMCLVNLMMNNNNFKSKILTPKNSKQFVTLLMLIWNLNILKFRTSKGYVRRS